MTIHDSEYYHDSPNRKSFVLKRTLVVEIQALLSRRRPLLLDRRWSFEGWPHSRDCCPSLTLTCQNSPWRRSCECCNKFLSSPLLAIVWAWLPRGICVNWNELRYCACAVTAWLFELWTHSLSYSWIVKHYRDSEYYRSGLILTN